MKESLNHINVALEIEIRFYNRRSQKKHEIEQHGAHVLEEKYKCNYMEIVFIKVMQSKIWYSMRRAVNLILTGRNISVNCVERGSSICTRKCRSTKESNIKDTSDCLSLDVLIMLMHHTYGDWYGGSTEICYTFFIVHLPWVGIRVCTVIGVDHIQRYVMFYIVHLCWVCIRVHMVISTEYVW